MNTVSEWIESCATYDGTPFMSQTRQQQQQQQQQHSMRHGLQDQAQHLQQLTQHQLQELTQHQLQLQHHHHQQQLVHAYNCSSSMTSIQHEVNNDMLIAMSLASSTNSPTATGMSNCDSIDNDTFPMPSLGFPRPRISIDYNDPSASASDSDSNAAALWAQLVMATSGNDIDGNPNSYSPFLSLPMLPFPGSGLSPTEQDQEILTPTIVPSQQPSSPSPVAAPTTTSYPPTPILASHASFAASVDKMAMNPMGAHEQFTAILYSWSQLNHPVNNVMDQFGNVTPNSLAHYPSSSLASSPALSTTSSFTACSGYTASPSPAPSVYSPSLLSASFFETNNNGDNNSNSNNSNYINTNPSNTITTTTTHNFVPRSTSKLTRRLSQTVQLKTSSLSSLSSSSSSSSSSPSSPSSSPSLKSGSVFGNRQASSHSPLWLSTSVPPLTCPTCKKHYANNSTLRRHQRIHDLELNNAKQLALDRSPLGSGGGEGTVAAKTEKVDNVGNTSTLLEDTESLAHRRSLCSGVSLLSLSDIKQQEIDPAHEDLPDPNLRKPECVGCKKAFARRDTVILHIKNQKRKWDLLNAILRNLTAVNCDALQVDAMQSISITSTAAAVVAVPGVIPGENANGTGAGTGTSAGVVKNKKPQRQRRSHPYRMAEKLWHSTLQRHHISLTSNSSNNGRTTGGVTGKGNQSPSIKKEAADEYRVKVEEDEDDNDDDFNDDCDSFGRHCKLEDEGLSDEEVEDDEEEVDDDDDWPDLEKISKMDSQAKLQLMMRTMTLPPCWRVRKVRIFGEFGVLDQKVLQ